MTITLIIAGVAIGIILFQSAIIAPTVLKTVDFEATSKLLRAMWPKFFRILIVLGVAYGVLELLFVPGSVAWSSMVLGLVVGLPTFALLIIPATNRAADEKRSSRFQLLHRLSVVSTLLLLAVYIVDVCV